MKPKLWIGDDFYEDWYADPEPPQRTMTIMENEEGVEHSGLLDAEGNPLVRMKRRIGFV